MPSSLRIAHAGDQFRSVVPRISWLLLKGLSWQMEQKYVIRDFHPLVFFYVFGVLMLGVGLVLGLIELALRIAGDAITPATIVLVAVLLIAGLQMTLLAMWFDMEANQGLALSRSGRRAYGSSQRHGHVTN